MKSQSILTIGSLDAWGATGILADRNCLTAMGFKPISLVAGIMLDGEVDAVEAATVDKQLRTFFNARKIAGLKTGILATRDNIEVVSTFFEDHKTELHNLVVDVSVEGMDESPLLSSSAMSLLKMRLLPMATVAVTYLSEAERLAGVTVKTIENMKEAAEAIRMFGPKYVLVKADRIIENELVDILYDGIEHQFLFTKTIVDENLRFRRDVFASGLTAYLSKGYQVKEAIETAKSLGPPSLRLGEEMPA